MNLPCSSSTNVVSGWPRRTNSLIYPIGLSITLFAFWSSTLGLGSGQKAILDGVTNLESTGIPGDIVFNQI